MKSILYDKLTKIALVKVDQRRSFRDEEKFEVIQYSPYNYGEFDVLETFTNYDWAKKGFYYYIAKKSR
jgi:hypothetical protein